MLFYNRLEANKSEWAQNILKMLNKMSPTALKVTKKAIDEGSNKSLAECLIMEYRLVCACLKKSSDFAEGNCFSSFFFTLPMHYQ
jgi:3-hydroxyisobutyryl-CoA hydrolase